MALALYAELIPSAAADRNTSQDFLFVKDVVLTIAPKPGPDKMVMTIKLCVNIGRVSSIELILPSRAILENLLHNNQVYLKKARAWQKHGQVTRQIKPKISRSL